MNHIIFSFTGLVHFIAAIIALAGGTLVLTLEKGTTQHIYIGYIYAASMVILNGTAFGIYRLFGGFGPFHIAAIISLVTIIGGMIPVLTRKPDGSWLTMHFSFMYWSVIGLYAAFASEILTRIPESPFFGMVGLATAAIMIGGAIFFRRSKEDWSAIN